MQANFQQLKFHDAACHSTINPRGSPRGSPQGRGNMAGQQTNQKVSPHIYPLRRPWRRRCWRCHSPLIFPTRTHVPFFLFLPIILRCPPLQALHPCVSRRIHLSIVYSRSSPLPCRFLSLAMRGSGMTEPCLWKEKLGAACCQTELGRAPLLLLLFVVL